MTTALVPRRIRVEEFSERSLACLKKFQDEPAPEESAGPPQGVSHEDMIATLTEYGFDADALATADDRLLAEILRVYQQAMAGPPIEDATAEPPPDEAPGAGMAEGRLFGGSDNIRGVNQDEQMRAMWHKDPHGSHEDASTLAETGGRPKQVTVKYSENGKEKIVNLAEVLKPLVEAAVKPVRDQLSAAERSVAKFQEAQKKNEIDAKWDLWLRQGRVLPAWEAKTKARLRRANAVQKFSDGKTEFDLQVEEIEAGPSLIKYGEMVRSAGKGSKGAADEELQRVERFAEEDQGIARALKAAGRTPADYVATFRKAKEKKPALTAREYGVPADYLN